MKTSIFFACLFAFISVLSCSKRKAPESFRNRLKNQRPKHDNQNDIDRMTKLMINFEHFATPQSFIEEKGLSLMNPKNSRILNQSIKGEHANFLLKVLTIIDSAEINLEALKMSISMQKPKIFKSLAVPELIKTPIDEHYILTHIIKVEAFGYLKILLENGFKFEGWRGINGQNISHIIAQNDLIDCIDYVPNDLLWTCDINRNASIFYAKSAAMIRRIRLRIKGSRNYLNKSGWTAWQIALFNNQYELLSALISPQRRYKIWKSFQLNYFKMYWVQRSTSINVRRSEILLDSYDEIMNVNAEKWFRPKPMFFIKFENETEFEASSLIVDWISNLLHAFFSSPDCLLFSQIDGESGLYAPNLTDKEHLSYYKFAGSVVGIAFVMNIGLKMKFIPAIYKGILHQNMDWDLDLLEQSPSIHRNLKLLNDPSIELSDLELFMPSDPKVPVNRENLQDYILEYSKDVLYEKYKDQISSFVEGFEVVQALSAYKYFKLVELKNKLTGRPVDFSGQEFGNYIDCESSLVRSALMKFVDEISPHQRQLLIQFITGFNSLPENGLVGLDHKINVYIDSELIGKLPTSSICSKHLFVAPFTNYETFKRNLMMAIELTCEIDHEPRITDEHDRVNLVFDYYDGVYDFDSYYNYSDSESEVESEMGEETGLTKFYSQIISFFNFS